MTAATTMTSRDYFADLQEEMVSIVALTASILGYLWLGANIWAAYLAYGDPGRSPAVLSWVGAGVLLACAIGSYVWRGAHVRWAAYVLAWGILIAVASAVQAFILPVSAIAHLFILPVLLAGALLSQRAFWLVAVTAFAVALGLGLALSEAPLASVEVGLPLIVLALVTLATWLSTRRLFTALEWVWHGYQEARTNEDIARDRQAELQRTAKALDEATYRLERANYTLAWARDQAEEARRLKQQFAQTISHELRTPLNLIVGFTELMTQSPEYYGEQLSPRYLRDLRIIHRNARHLQTLINDVLDLARIESAQMTLVREEVSPAALVHEAVNAARSLIESQGLTLHVTIAEKLPPLWVDPTRIRQVLFNLLNNAARFTEQGAVTITVVQQGEDVVFTVADTGMGIDPGMIDRIFEEFQQADGGTRRRHGGAGLGLAISKRFVVLHGGRIWVESQPGVGSRFHFSLPPGGESLHDLSGAVLSRTQSGQQTTESERPVLLAVTRSLVAASLLRRHIHGCNTVVVPDLTQGQAAVARLLPQAVVIDPAERTWGPDELQTLARSWGIPHTPIMACPLPGEHALAQRLDVNGYLVKPVSRQEVWDVLRPFGEGIDRILVVDDDEEFVQLMGRMLDSPVRRYQTIGAHNGQEALAMIRRRQPDLILLDMKLPGISGPELVERLRSRPEWRDIPIIIISAQDEPEIQESRMGPISITRAAPWASAEVVRWVQGMVDAALTPLATRSAPPAGDAP